ncbi:polysaccharide lyase [Pontibacter sp. E15-1]|uniref:polysaccharide lyase n=1 Tax=Pontibacter sp. E15-1 TaxID=2919918 RepID=UPI001F502AE4|nr:polysaccharide lyase [Pontibacter sp. E15-1]MCJ8167634.1 polysaccharide lyase [Pontibacter sp. E15-1]
MNFKLKSIFTPLLVGAVVVSCEQTDIEEVKPEAAFTAETSASATSANLLFEETFEGSQYFSGARKQFGTDYAFSVATNPIFSGSKSGRFELRDTDPITSGGTRSEVLFPEQSNQDRWYAFSVYFPSKYFQKDSKQDVISQWHQGGGKNPSSSLRILNDKLVFDVRKDPSSANKLYMGALIKDAWQTFVVHIKHSHNSDGLVEIWHDGKKVINYVGANSYDSSFDNPRWKMGIYKSDWNYDETTDTDHRVLYFDNVRMGSEKATYAEMAAGAKSGSDTPPTEPTPTEPTPTEPTPTEPTPTEPTPTEPTPTEPTPTEPTPTEPTPNEPVPTTPTENVQRIVSFTLINADTEEDVLTITDGATIQLKSLGLKRVAIRANSSPSTVGKVKFELSGAESRRSSDSDFPYALFGDNKKGNYYYGNWNPPTKGNYTLTATPYADEDDSKTAGASHTINFTIN